MSSRPSSPTAVSTASSQKPESVTSPAPGLLGVLVLAQVDDGDVGALPGEEHRDGAADPGIAAGDDGDLALELSRSAIRRRQELGPRLQLGLETRLGEMLLRQRRLGVSTLPGLHGAFMLLPAGLLGTPAPLLGRALEVSVGLGLCLPRRRAPGFLRAGPARAFLLLHRHDAPPEDLRHCSPGDDGLSGSRVM
jgi:hypothetical protein